ncbi:MAG: hypothetical protein JNJ41_14935 [Bacteroidia bacterium]|nr:hypothetical protein [Bacteroidia bacterium]
MKKKIVVVLFSLISVMFFAQALPVNTEILSRKAVLKLFTDTSNKQFNFTYPIKKVYKSASRYQTLYFVLTESNDSIVTNDTFNSKIKAFIFEEQKNKLSFVWSINDFIIKRESGLLENSIWFWTKYCEFTDIDGDRLIDPIFIYGASGNYDIEDARIKFVIYHKKQKVVIQHQNSPVDYGRNTKVDAVFYTLPLKIQNRVQLIMKQMEEKKHAIFPPTWQEEMKKKKLYFEEHHE